jgi:F-type H+-transporting ATPase subunit gamma
MPSLIDLRRRIRAVKSTQQITKAMKMIATSRMRRAQERVLGARPMARQAYSVLQSLASRVDQSMHPLLADRDDRRPGANILLLVVTADKGLCGGFNTNLIKEATRFILERRDQSVALGLIGRKGRDFFRRRGMSVHLERVNFFTRLEFTDAQAVAAVAIDEFTSGTADAVYVVFNEFKSILQQRIRVDRLLPLPRIKADPGVPPIEYLFEPSPQEIFDRILPTYVHIQIWQVLLESAAAEHAARMTAMDAATKNASEVIDSLTLYMNKVRQAGITREIIEVVSGAEAL